MITIKEIAKKANVSIGTVDRVLHKRGRVAAETQKKVEKIAKDGNYSSNVYARQLRLNQTYTISVIMPEVDSYWKQLLDGIDAGITEYKALGLVVNHIEVARDEEKEFSKAITQAIKAKSEGLVIAPGFIKPGNNALKKLQESGIPFVFVDCDIEDVDSLSFIGQNAFQSGVLSAQLLNSGGADDYVLFIATQHANDLKNGTIMSRIAGFKDYCLQLGYKGTIREVNFERDGLDQKSFKNMLVDCNKPVHVYIPNSRASNLVKHLNRVKAKIGLRCVGYDLVLDNIDCLNKGTIDFIISQKPHTQGFLAIKSLYRHLVLKETVEKQQYMPLDIITKINLPFCDS